MRIKYRIAAGALLAYLLPAMAFNGAMPDKTDEAATGSDSAQETSGGPAFKLTDVKRIAAGRDRFQATCAAFCHGHEPALFINREGLEPQYVFNTIRDGGKGATPMPPWGEVFAPEEIWEIVAYLKSIGHW